MNLLILHSCVQVKYGIATGTKSLHKWCSVATAHILRFFSSNSFSRFSLSFFALWSMIFCACSGQGTRGPVHAGSGAEGDGTNTSPLVCNKWCRLHTRKTHIVHTHPTHSPTHTCQHPTHHTKHILYVHLVCIVHFRILCMCNYFYIVASSPPGGLKGHSGYMVVPCGHHGNQHSLPYADTPSVTHPLIYVYTPTTASTYTHTCVHVHTCIRTCVCIHTHIRTRIYTHAHTQTSHNTACH